MTRLVGYLEYSKALSLFEPLVRHASEDEIRVIEEIIGSKDEYIVYSNLASQFVRTVKDNDANPSQGPQLRRGLGWLMALARVELGAMLAGFTDRPDPFTVLPPTRYELPQFAEILLDSSRTHFLALRNDRVAQFYWSKRNDQVTLDDLRHGKKEINERQAIAYARRVSIAREFVTAVGQLAENDYSPYALSPQEASELKYGGDELDKLQATIVRKVLVLSYNSEFSGSQTRNYDRFCDCPRLTEIARAELQSGAASQRSLGRTRTQTVRED